MRDFRSTYTDKKELLSVFVALNVCWINDKVQKRKLQFVLLTSIFTLEMKLLRCLNCISFKCFVFVFIAQEPIVWVLISSVAQWECLRLRGLSSRIWWVKNAIRIFTFKNLLIAARSLEVCGVTPPCFGGKQASRALLNSLTKPYKMTTSAQGTDI